jgi:ParB/Sulfiredoxin domain
MKATKRKTANGQTDLKPYQELPPLSAEDRAALKADIDERGIQVPIEYDQDGNIIDGHHRAELATELGLPEKDWPKIVRTYADDKARRTQALRLNLARRHLDQAEKRAIIEAEIKDNPNRSNRTIAKELRDVGLPTDHKVIGNARGRLEASGAIPQLEKTPGKDEKLRSTRRAPKAAKSNGKDKPKSHAYTSGNAMPSPSKRKPIYDTGQWAREFDWLFGQIMTVKDQQGALAHAAQRLAEGWPDFFTVDPADVGPTDADEVFVKAFVAFEKAFKRYKFTPGSYLFTAREMIAEAFDLPDPEPEHKPTAASAADGDDDIPGFLDRRGR